MAGAWHSRLHYLNKDSLWRSGALTQCYATSYARFRNVKEGKRQKMRGRGVKERLKGKDSLRERGKKKAHRVSDRKNRELLREGGKIQREAEIKRIKRGGRE